MVPAYGRQAGRTLFWFLKADMHLSTALWCLHMHLEMNRTPRLYTVLRHILSASIRRFHMVLTCGPSTWCQVGHTFFWFLKAEMHLPTVRERYGVLLDIYLRNCGGHRVALGHQILVMRRLEVSMIDGH
jgi:hypothetical protein